MWMNRIEGQTGAPGAGAKSAPSISLRQNMPRWLIQRNNALKNG